MNYIIFNNDGSIKNIGFADIIVQGDDNTDEIYCAIEGRSNDAYLASAYFELPNGDSNSLSGVASSFSVDGNRDFIGSSFINDNFLVNGTARERAVRLSTRPPRPTPPSIRRGRAIAPWSLCPSTMA